MSDFSEFESLDIGRQQAPASDHNGLPTSSNAVPSEPRSEPAPGTAPTDAGPEDGTWHAEAGRKGAHRIHQLIEEGRLYEKEHGLKRGRQRLRQLIELGKLYERDHGLRAEHPRRSRRLSRMSKKQALTNLFETLVRVAKPSLRSELQRLLRSLDDLAA